MKILKLAMSYVVVGTLGTALGVFLVTASLRYTPAPFALLNCRGHLPSRRIRRNGEYALNHPFWIQQLCYFFFGEDSGFQDYVADFTFFFVGFVGEFGGGVVADFG